MYKKILIGLAAMMFSVPAFAAVTAFVGIDQGAAPADPRPNSDTARAAMESFFPALPGGSPILTEDFESLPLGYKPNGALGPYIVLSSTNLDNPNSGISNGLDTILGYNTTFGGTKHYKFWADDFGDEAGLTFEFLEPVQAWGAYFTGIEPNFANVFLRFTDGTSHSVLLNGAAGGGSAFYGFTDPGKFIAWVRIFENNAPDLRDIFGIDDLVMVASSDIARFKVTKGYDDGNTAPVDVEIQCNDGNPSSDSATIDGGDPIGHTFVVGDLSENTGTTCTITESGTSGYTSNFPNGCVFNDVVAGDYECHFYNTPAPVTVTVVKTWVLPDTGGNGELVPQVAPISIYCGGELVANDVLTGSDSLSVEVTPAYPSTSCYATEGVINSAVEQQNLGCGTEGDPGMTISAGHGDSCEFVNTVFYEGIPTLSQWGMALMALLMLGVGFIGFRRFV